MDKAGERRKVRQYASGVGISGGSILRFSSVGRPVKHKNIFVISLVLLAVASSAASVVLLFHRALSSPLFTHRSSPTPPQLKQARVVLGDWFLMRSQLVETGMGLVGEALKGPDIGPISDIAIRKLHRHAGLPIVIAGRYGAMVIDRNGLKQSQVRYDFETEQIKLGPFRRTKTDTNIGDIQIVDIDGDGGYEFLGRGSLDGAALFDLQGRRLWSYPQSDKERISLENVTVGDLNDDRQAEFIVSSNGIEAFDRFGKQLWRRPAENGPSQIEVVDTDGSGKKKIVSIGFELEIRDESGNKIKSVETPAGYVGNFSLCTMPNKKVPIILAVKDGYFWLIDFDGNAVARFDAPLSDFPDVVEKTPRGEFRTSAYKAKGVWVKLVKDQPEYLAAVAEFVALDRSVLYVYTASGKLVYQEVLPEECASIAVLPPENESGSEEFLVGGSRTVWRYKAK